MTCQLVFSKEDVLRRVTAMKHAVIDNSPHEHYTPESAWWMLNATNKSRSILPTAITLSEQVGVPVEFFKKHFGGNRWQTHFVTHFPSFRVHSYLNSWFVTIRDPSLQFDGTTTPDRSTNVVLRSSVGWERLKQYVLRNTIIKAQHITPVRLPPPTRRILEEQNVTETCNKKSQDTQQSVVAVVTPPRAPVFVVTSEIGVMTDQTETREFGTMTDVDMTINIELDERTIHQLTFLLRQARKNGKSCLLVWPAN
jgi:hypothetical protein